MDNQLLKIFIGFALETELFNRRYNYQLFDLYAKPNIKKVKQIYEQLLKSDNHQDRSIAFWLEPILQLKNTIVNIESLIIKLQKIELVLSDLLWQVTSSSQNDLNVWLNAISNALESLKDNNWIDTKLFISKAYEISMNKQIFSTDKYQLRTAIQFLKQTTIYCYHEVKRHPIKITIIPERLPILLRIQSSLIQLIQKYHFSDLEPKYTSLVLRLIQKFNSIQTFLMRPKMDLNKIQHTISQTIDYLNGEMEYLLKSNNMKKMNWLMPIQKELTNVRTLYF